MPESRGLRAEDVMKCEWAEGYLSAYLDNTLDPPLRAEVSEHLASCERCSAILADYRRYDALLADAVRITPPESLRDRIFSSPEFSAILQSSARQADRQASKPTLGPRWRTPTPMFPIPPLTPTTPPTETRAAQAGETATPSTASPVAPVAHPIATPPFRQAGRLPLTKVLLPVAAVLALALGVSLLFQQGFFPFGASRSQTPGRTTTVYGAPDFSTAPLAAGPRLVFAHNGALWSAPEAGPTGAPGAAQRLTPPSVSVVAWSVSPIATGQGGAWIVYVDGRTGALHLVRSDRQADQIIGAVTATPAKGQTLAAAFWASQTGRALRASLSWSPTGKQIAYLTASSDGRRVALGVITLTTSSDPASPVGVSHQGGWSGVSGVTTRLAWSADGAWLAFAQAPLGASATSGQSVWLYDAATGHVRQLAAQADPAHSTATVARLAIAQGGGLSVVTWAASDGAAISGVFTQSTTATTPTRLTPVGVTITAADVAANGEWLVAAGDALASVSALAPASATTAGASVAGLHSLATLSAPAQEISWSPTGAVAAIVSQDDLALWSPTTGLTQVADGVAFTPALAWSADGHRLAFQAGDLLTSAQVSGGRATTLTALWRSAQVSNLLWSPDGRLLAIAAPSGALLAANDGSLTTRIAPYEVDDGALAWSIAG